MNIYKELYRVKSQIKPEELFSSAEFKNSLNSAINTALHGLDREVSFRMLKSDDGRTTAYTNGQQITVNILSPVLKNKMNNMFDWYTGIIGHAIHECSHVLFTDFNTANRIADSYHPGYQWYPEQPKHKNAEMIAVLIDTQKWAARYFGQLYQQLDNIFEDQYIEHRAMNLFGGLYAKSLVIGNEDRYHQSPTKEEIIGSADVHDLIPAALTWFWIKSLGFYTKDVRSERELTPDEAKIEDRLNNCWIEIQPYIEILKYEKNGLERAKACNEILCAVSDLTDFTENQNKSQDESNQQQSDSSQQGDSSENPESGDESNGENGNSQTKSQNNSENSSPDSAQADGDSDDNGSCKKTGSQGEGFQGSCTCTYNFEEAAEKISAPSLGTQIPVGYTSPINDPELNAIDNSSDAIDNALNQIAESQIDQNNLTNLKKMMNGTSAKYHIFYPGSDMYDNYMYKEFVRQVSVYRDKTINMLSRVLRDRKEEAPRANMTGKFSTSQYIRGIIHESPEYFTRRHEPGEKPDVAFAIRIDYSGSMQFNNRYIAAQKSAILMDMIFNKMKIPYMIYSDEMSSQYYPRIDMHIYHDFDSLINHIDAIADELPDGNSTPEPSALLFGYERLLQRPEKHKVMISITDGEPNESSLKFSEDAMIDCKMMVDHYRKKGIVTFAAAISGNMEVINSVYGNKVMDCTKLENLPSKLTALCRRFILK